MNIDFSLPTSHNISHVLAELIQKKVEFREIYDDYSSYLISKYNVFSHKFDTAEDISCMFPSFAVSREAAIQDVVDFYCWTYLFSNTAKNGFTEEEFKNLLIITGKFTLLFIGSSIFKQDKTSNHLLNRSASNILSILYESQCSFEYSPLARIMIMNLFYLCNCSTEEDVCDIMNCIQNNGGDDVMKGIFDDAITWYLGFISNEHKAVDLSHNWLYAYVFKKRFGFIYYRKISISNINQFKYSIEAYSPCFTFFKRQITNTSKAVVIKIGENKRNSNFTESEQQWCYNFSKMKFE